MKISNLYIISFFSLLIFSCGEEVPEEPVPTETISDKIIYSKNPNGYNELYKLENGQESLLISDENFDYWWSKVSPDKTNILVYRSPTNPSRNHDDYEQADLLIADIDGSKIEVIIPKGAYGWNAHGVARWSNDGQHILMCAEVDIGNSFQWRLIRTNKTGGEPIVLSDRWAIDCNFSNDNKHIVFMGFMDNQLSFDLTNLELQRGDYDSNLGTVTNIESLTDNNTRDHDPDFSPNDTQILFSAGNALYTDVDLVVYDLATNMELVIHDDASANGGSMCWSPDGSKVYFHSLNIVGHPFRIKSVNLETGDVTTLLQTGDNGFGFIHPEAY